MKYIKYLAVSALCAMSLTSCNDYLDRLPDDRAEVKTVSQVKELLTSAYPQGNNNTIMELMSDNVSDNGTSYASTPLKDELYRFEDVDDTGNDSPYFVWNQLYMSVATANQALEYLGQVTPTEESSAVEAEAKMIRAYSMFQLATTFCMAWDESKADEYMGLPYPKEPAKFIGGQYDRGTLRQLYANIDKDIEEALPKIDESIYTVPKYHFNRKAAYAFAARFNLYYNNMDKCIAYANEVLGSDPRSYLRDFEQYTQFGAQDIGNKYIQSGEKSNLMLLASYSAEGYMVIYPVYPRFQHNQSVCSYGTFWAKAPWGQGSGTDAQKALLYYANMMYGSNTAVQFPKMLPQMEITDKINQTGYLHIVDPIFTGDETLLCRAEAYARKKMYTEAVADINLWIENHCRAQSGDEVRPVMTEELINEFMEQLDYTPVTLEYWSDLTIRKELHPQGFEIEAGTQENMINLILHMRRLETIFQGLRFPDLKRYGIAYSHLVQREDPLVFQTGDLRGAVQLPNDVIKAGLPANPR